MGAANVSLRKKDRDRPRQTAPQQFFDGSWNLKAGFDHGDPLMLFTNESERMAFTEHCVQNWQELRSVGCQVPHHTVPNMGDPPLTSKHIKENNYL